MTDDEGGTVESVEKQRELADRLISVFESGWAVEGEGPSLGDLLDDLASAGLKLVELRPDEENVASLAYMEVAREARDS